jgi:hypothetical protein
MKLYQIQEDQKFITLKGLPPIEKGEKVVVFNKRFGDGGVIVLEIKSIDNPSKYYRIEGDLDDQIDYLKPINKEKPMNQVDFSKLGTFTQEELDKGVTTLNFTQFGKKIGLDSKQILEIWKNAQDSEVSDKELYEYFRYLLDKEKADMLAVYFGIEDSISESKKFSINENVEFREMTEEDMSTFSGADENSKIYFDESNNFVFIYSSYKGSISVIDEDGNELIAEDNYSETFAKYVTGYLIEIIKKYSIFDVESLYQQVVEDSPSMSDNIRIVSSVLNEDSKTELSGLKKKITLSEFAKLWNDHYGESFQKEYSGMYNHLSKLEKRLSYLIVGDIVDSWKELYGEDFKKEYYGLYEKIIK